MSRDLDSLKNLSKTELTELALTYLDSPIDLAKFNVTVNYSRRYMYAYFSLKNDATYIPHNTQAIYNFHVNLLTGSVKLTMQSNFDSHNENQSKRPTLEDLYVPTKVDQENLSFVLEQL